MQSPETGNVRERLIFYGGTQTNVAVVQCSLHDIVFDVNAIF